MKITAHFDSPDSADFAAGALRNVLSPLSAIETKNLPYKRSADSMNVFAAYNTVSTTPTYSMPLYNPTGNRFISSREQDMIGGTEHILQVICRNEEAHIASQIIINHGGRNISKI
ncbi:MAG: hypothetical protein J1E40_12170 [Oscillospiraceae bacterium]|nr:hypothetical protein [Oscillospiraceae bacterium]